MPIYIRYEGVKGDVTAEGHNSASAGGTNGGVWKTTTFITAEPAGLVQVSQIALADGTAKVEGSKMLTLRNALEFFNAANRLGPGGKLYVATETGVFNADSHGRLVVGTEQGVWNSKANRATCANNLKQLGLGAHHFHTVKIIVSDAGSAYGRTILLRDVNVSPGRTAGELALDYSRLEY